MFFNTMRGNHLEDKFRFFFNAMHRGAFCQFPFRWIYHYDSNEYTGKETEKNTSVLWGESINEIDLQHSSTQWLKSFIESIRNIFQYNGVKPF